MVFKDEIITNTSINLSIMDRIRVLFGKTIRLEVRVKTENEIGRNETSSVARVDKFIKFKRKHAGYECSSQHGNGKD